jgi:hypothetical protein
LLNAPSVSSNGLSHHVVPYDLAQFHPAVRKSLQKLQLLRDGISIDPIIKKIADWESPLEQVFYVSSLYLKISKGIHPKIQIKEQYRVANGGKGYCVDFRLSLTDEVFPDLDPFIAFIECDSREFHDRTPEELTKDRQRWRELQRQGGKVYPFTGKELLKNPEKCVKECTNDLRRDLLARQEMFTRVFP